MGEMMAKQYFEKFPLTGVDVDGSGERRIAINILQRSKIREVFTNHYLIFYEYPIKDGERPEHIAHKLYGSSNYQWLVLFANDIVDPYHDWPLSYDDMILTMRKKYTTSSRDGLEFAYVTLHHYEDVHGNVIDETTFLSLPVAERAAINIYEWEMAQNEAKRTIRLLDKKFVDQIDAELDAIMKRPLK